MSAASTSAKSIARALGGDLASHNKISCPGPGHSPCDRSLSITLDSGVPDGFIVHSFAGDDWRTCRDYVKKKLGLSAGVVSAQRLKGARSPCDVDSYAKRKTEFALSLWHEAKPAAGTIVEKYLESRSLMLPSPVIAADAIRFHPRCLFKADTGSLWIPAMVALMRNAVSNEPQGIHRTALAADGSGKCSLPSLGNAKRMLGAAAGAVVKLCDDAEVTNTLAIAEGIETSLSVLIAGWTTTWAALSAVGMERFPIITAIESLTVFADNDISGRGLVAARRCAERWMSTGAECIVIAPKVAGVDWNDIAQRGAA